MVPKLVYASKVLAERTDADNNLNAEQLQALEVIFLLVTNLVHAEQRFLEQFCNAVSILNMFSHITKVFWFNTNSDNYR